jgi:hypothetical protein
VIDERSCGRPMIDETSCGGPVIDERSPVCKNLLENGE